LPVMGKFVAHFVGDRKREIRDKCVMGLHRFILAYAGQYG